MARGRNEEAAGAMPPMSVSTDDVEGRDGFAWWTEMTDQALMPISVSVEHADSFQGKVNALRTSRFDLAAFSLSALTARRTPAHIREFDPEDYWLVLVHGSPIGLEQRRTNSLITAGQMTIYDTSHPLTCEFFGDGRSSRLTLMRLPGRTLPVPRDRLTTLLATRLPTEAGSGDLLISYLAALRATSTRCEPAELRRISETAVDLATAFLAARLGGYRDLPAETRREALLARIDAFIDGHLPDPDLDPAAIAACHHISVRTLHAMFEQRSETVGATIRRRRLEGCLADLGDPRFRRRTIGEIAGRWGFRHPADFSRAFRRAYGMTPSDFRHRADGDHARPPTAPA